MTIENWEDAAAEREARETLRDAIRPTDRENVVDFCRRLVERQSYGAWDDGQGEMLIDTYSASAVVAVHDAVSADGGGRDKLRAMTMQRVVAVCFTVINKKRK